MNEIFLQKLRESKTPKNEKLLESVERLYIVCEQKAQCEASLGKYAAVAGIAGAAGLGGGLAAHDAVKDFSDETGKKYTEFVDETKKDDANHKTVFDVKARSQEGKSVLQDLHGYQYVDVSQHPGLYSGSFNGIPLDQLDKEDYVQVGWYVSPDGTKYYSTVTGDVYKVPDGQTFDQVTAENRGEKLGNGVLATGDVSESEIDQCSISMAGMYGKDSSCGPSGYQVKDDKAYEWLGAQK